MLKMSTLILVSLGLILLSECGISCDTPADCTSLTCNAKQEKACSYSLGVPPKKTCKCKCKGKLGKDCVSCISENDRVLRENGNWAYLKDIEIGDRIHDGDGITTVLVNVIGELGDMFKIFLKDINNASQTTHITLTYDHLLYDVNNKLIAAEHIKKGMILSNNFMVENIEKDKQRLTSPITFSGYLQVNGIKASCYGKDETYAQLAHDYFSIFRWASNNINQYVFGVFAEWIVRDSEWYDMQLVNIFGAEFVYNSWSFILYAPIITAIIFGTRMLKSIMISIIVSIVIIFVIKKKGKVLVKKYI